MMRFVRDESAQGMSEYVLILALVAIGVIGVLTLFKGSLQAKFQQITNTLTNASTT